MPDATCSPLVAALTAGHRYCTAIVRKYPAAPQQATWMFVRDLLHDMKEAAQNAENAKAPKAMNTPNDTSGPVGSRDLLSSIKGLIDALEAARRGALVATDSPHTEMRERWFGKAAAFREAAGMARRCLDNAKLSDRHE